MNRGFDQFYGTLGNTPFVNPTNFVDSRISPDSIKMDAKNFYTTDAFADRAVAFVEQNKDKPFFLYLPFNAVHSPSEAPQKYRDRFKGIKDYKRNLYAAMLSAMDDAVGRVLQKLRDLKLEEQTLVFFLSDNGGATTRLEWGANTGINKPLKGEKADTWEGGIRVPFFVQWKGRLPAGKTYELPVIQLDILPTAIAAAGGEVQKDWKCDGVNLLPYLEGKNLERPHEMLYWRLGPQWAIRQGEWKLVQGYDYNQKQGGAIQTVKVELPKLYHLTEDIGETKDLSAQQPERVKALRAAWEAWNKELAKPAW